ncbi:hypothetical protein ig2599ANME_0660 [groundwater metagenome]
MTTTMPNNSKIEQFLQKLAPCIERGELEACVEEAARVAREMGVGAGELLELSTDERRNEKYSFAYVIALAAAQELEGGAKAQAYSYAGLASQYAGNIQKAEEYYRKAIEADPKYAERHSNYASLLEELNRNKEAEEQYQKAIEANPKDAEAHNNYANLLREKAMFLEAEKEVRIALQIEPKDPYALGTYGDILADEDYLEEAIKNIMRR